jgi:hypothetical protein
MAKKNKPDATETVKKPCDVKEPSVKICRDERICMMVDCEHWAKTHPRRR